jgi:hypothetical protein
VDPNAELAAKARRLVIHESLPPLVEGLYPQLAKRDCLSHMGGPRGVFRSLWYLQADDPARERLVAAIHGEVTV